MEPITKIEFEKHKMTCGESFDDIKDQLSLLNRAMFGDKKLEQKGVHEMTTEMYKSVITANGWKRVGNLVLAGAGGVTIVSAAFWTIVELFKRIKLS